jgi:hypothetical protein
MAWSFFKKRADPVNPDAALWWRNANAVALQPTRERVDELRPRIAAETELDERERQVEMIEGLDQLCLVIASAALPVLDTQHRVIGSDACHFMAPVSAPDHGDAIGKLFLTSQRVIFAGGASIAWPWHRVRRVARHERDVLFEGGDTLALRLRCNSYGDALAAAAIGDRLKQR